MLYLSISYLPNIQYFTKTIAAGEIVLEAQENYQRQSYRNRCHIYGANGIQVLTIPVEKMLENKLIRDITIAYHTPWQANHWKSIVSAYKNSPYFEHYESELISFYQRREKFLWDFNLKLFMRLLELLNIKLTINKTTSYTPIVSNDWRNAIHPKAKYSRADHDFNPTPYYQVFAEKHGFIPNLSIIDLLFNEGPGAIQVLKKSTNQWLK